VATFFLAVLLDLLVPIVARLRDRVEHVFEDNAIGQCFNRWLAKARGHAAAKSHATGESSARDHDAVLLGQLRHHAHSATGGTWKDVYNGWNMGFLLPFSLDPFPSFIALHCFRMYSFLLFAYFFFFPSVSLFTFSPFFVSLSFDSFPFLFLYGWNIEGWL
jgi:hypothetical protein